MEHENSFSLMMDALDGELTEASRLELEAHLRACPPCAQEWQALVAIDQLFRQTPALAPAADFAQRTLARLPNRRTRLLAMSIMYMMVLGAGVIPVLIGVWAVTALQPVLSRPGLLNSLLSAANHVAQAAGAVIAAILDGAGAFILQQPAVFGWLLVMAGIVSIWSGVYQQYLIPQRQELS